MKRSRHRLTKRVFNPVMLALVTMSYTSLSALAQEASELRPPNPGNIKGPVGVLVLLVVAVLAGLLILAATFPSKRGHQD